MNTSSSLGLPQGAIWVRLPRFIGDSLMMSQALDPLRQSGRPLVAWGPAKIVDLYRDSNAFAAVCPDDPKAKGAWVLARQLRQAKAAGVISLARSLRPLLAGWLARVPLRIGWEDGGGRYLATHHAPWWQHALHHLDRYDALLRQAFPGLPTVFTPRPFRPRPEAEAAAAALLASHGLDSQFVVLSLGGNEWNKRLEAGPWIGLLRGLEAQGLPALLLGHGPEEEALAEAILAQTQWPLNLVGRVSLPDTAGLLHWSRGMVGNDSAAAHLASAMGCPTVAAFGPTRPDWSAPRGPHVRIVRREGLDCLACGLHGCPVPDHPCMRDLPAEALLAALQEVLRPTPQGRPISPVQPA